VSDLSTFLLRDDPSIRDAMACIDRNAKGIALVVDGDGRLTMTITDGDIRRALLARTPLEAPVSELPERDPVTAPAGTPRAELIHHMTSRSLRHLPLVDEAGKVVDIALLDELVRRYELPLTAVVMAGGFGTRLRPLTEAVPKPMLPVAGKPLLEHIVEQLGSSGIRRVNLTTHYKPETISDHFGDGSRFGLEIGYMHEDEPLGTAGALRLLEASDDPLLVMNGDILTRVDFRAMLDFHREHRAVMTVAVRQEEFAVPFGVVQTQGAAITSIEEKPVLREFINAGIYLLDPGVRRYLPAEERFDMPQLVERLLDAGETVAGFPVHEYWVDIGELDAYEQAGHDAETGKLQQ
jgi:dTDP-glucose pyrophosphorylase